MTAKQKYKNVSEIDVSTNQGKAYYDKMCISNPVDKTNGDILAAQALSNLAGPAGTLFTHVLERIAEIEKSLYVSAPAPVKPSVGVI